MAERGFISVEMEGMTEIANKLRRIPGEVTLQEIETMLLGVAEPIARDMRASAPRSPGRGHAGGGRHAADLIAALPAPNKRAEVDVAQVEVGPTKKGFYLRFHEFGTFKLSARPFMRPTWDSHSGSVLRNIGEGLRGIVSEAIRNA